LSSIAFTEELQEYWLQTRTLRYLISRKKKFLCTAL